MNILRSFGVIVVAIILIVGGFLLFGLFTIEPGQVGVRFDPMSGGVQQIQYNEGLHIKAPWVQVYPYSVKTQVYTMSGAEDAVGGIATHAPTVRTVTNEGLYVDLDVSIQYHIVADKAWEILQQFGAEGVYQDVIVLPQIRSTLRDVVAKYPAATIYGEGKKIVETEIFNDLMAKLQDKNVVVEQVLLRSVTLPEQLTQAIEAKKRAEQEALAMQYVLQKAEQEKQQKIIEAEGIAEANEIIAGSITQQYLEWYWIQSMAQNPKAIYIPVGGDGLPMFIQPEEP